MSKEVNKEEANDKLKELRKELEAEIEDQLPKEDDYLRVEVERAVDISPDDHARIKRVIEALLFASGRPLTIQEFRKVLKNIKPSDIERFVRELKEEYEKDGRSFRIIDVAEGYEISTEPRYAPWIMKLELQKRVKQATQAALETLAILAYKQPVTRVEIEDLRGVDASGVLSTLLDRGFIKIVGRKEVPGRPLLYGTTDKFLEHFGLKSLKDLPNISEIRSLVESAVKKEDLMRREKIVEDKEPGAVPSEGEVPTEAMDAARKEEQELVNKAFSDIDKISITEVALHEELSSLGNGSGAEAKEEPVEEGSAESTEKEESDES
ncbi:MAG: SMC-Scp complex subunit ScpB [Candidatus Omnitrophica bacterium]|nr:SMC-Scp complex subunit ScpB [Candidatus Omnitrophota bacterium]